MKLNFCSEENARKSCSEAVLGLMLNQLSKDFFLSNKVSLIQRWSEESNFYAAAAGTMSAESLWELRKIQYLFVVGVIDELCYTTF